MFYKVKGVYAGRVFNHDGTFVTPELTKKLFNSYEETLYIQESSIMSINETTRNLIVSNGVGLDVYELSEKELKNLIRKIDFK